MAIEVCLFIPNHRRFRSAVAVVVKNKQTNNEELMYLAMSTNRPVFKELSVGIGTPTPAPKT